MTTPGKRSLTFVDGIGVGIGALAMLPILYFTASVGMYEAMYKDMGPSARLPMLTKIVFSPLWRYGVPMLLIGGFVAALVVRPHRVVTLLVAVAALLAAAIWYLGLYAPIFELAGNIRG